MPQSLNENVDATFWPQESMSLVPLPEAVESQQSNLSQTIDKQFEFNSPNTNVCAGSSSFTTSGPLRPSNIQASSST